MDITTNKSLTLAQKEFLAIKCALKGPVDEYCGKREETWKLPCLNPNIRPKSDTPYGVPEDIKKSESPAKSKK